MDTLTTVLTAMSRKLKKEATEKQVEVLLYDAKEDEEVEVKEEKLAVAKVSIGEEAMSNNTGLWGLIDGVVAIFKLL